MTVHPLVEAFYARIWNAGQEYVDDVLTEDFAFRGSLGAETSGRPAFMDYVYRVRGSLAQYRCDILTCVTELPQAFARMRFSGLHVAPFRGFEPTGKAVHWDGAALFTFRGEAIASLWVLGDLAGLDAVLQSNASSQNPWRSPGK
jgi:predicted ester cyclase